jgi:hypothetical protein
MSGWAMELSIRGLIIFFVVEKLVDSVVELYHGQEAI